MKQFFLAILFSSFLINETKACGEAHQNRLFLIGKSDANYVFFETHLHRKDSRTMFSKSYSWEGITYLKTYDKFNNQISSTPIDTLIDVQDLVYDTVIKHSFKKCINLAQSLPNIKFASIEKFIFADFERKCSIITLVIDTLSNQSYLIWKKKTYPISILNDSSSIAQNYTERFKNDDIHSLYISMYYEVYISSVRIFKIENEKILIAHLAGGERPFGPNGDEYKGKEYKPTFKYGENQHTYFQEPLIYHGNGFDFFIIE
jgi:hypothetical protein